MAESPLSSVDGDFVDPFDRLALKGQSSRPARPAGVDARDRTIVELADEFGLTTAAALELCDEAGIPAEGGGSKLAALDADRLRTLASRAAIASEKPADDDEGLSLVARLNRRS